MSLFDTGSPSHADFFRRKICITEGRRKLAYVMSNAVWKGIDRPLPMQVHHRSGTGIRWVGRTERDNPGLRFSNIICGALRLHILLMANYYKWRPTFFICKIRRETWCHAAAVTLTASRATTAKRRNESTSPHSTLVAMSDRDRTGRARGGPWISYRSIWSMHRYTQLKMFNGDVGD
ncbi:hypothetical protein BS50DRAFT_106707 [Corynespora cassiicola Philippines]|uniref:Uncharacterized protein n=1 Tax=Corynespora cassiicola Philippines TaxID=1448308 RepID=A0A2T2NCM9_CORCC|nr:hypothetical protein BS50DRAFT_106707 [Corynespora cassiicola Philippines]